MGPPLPPPLLSPGSGLKRLAWKGGKGEEGWGRWLLTRVAGYCLQRLFWFSFGEKEMVYVDRWIKVDGSEYLSR
jgi:hypothetical protein